MNKIVANYKNIIRQIDLNEKKFNRKIGESKLIAVSKTFSSDVIQVLIDEGQRVFGENKVQEADKKWSDLKDKNKNLKIELHLIGPLQSNKVNQALNIFDVIQTLDREKIALKIKDFFEEKQIENNKRFLVQVNIGEEKQKSGLEINSTKNFVEWCINDLNLNIIGLMCIPPLVENSEFFFKKLRKLTDDLNLKHTSMGMTNDFASAIKHGATFIRIGTGIFGDRF